MILLLKWRPYQVNRRINTTNQWMMKLRVLLEGTHGRSFQGIKLRITTFFQENGPSSERRNMIGLSEKPIRDIV